ncbi:hypothetical protein CHU92_04335 [Flavobacterium cyanobacteriorum]|uniref:Uncharacterized protein n=1 Tax=Flavobacterium cyanobacteriorum TaxID=2022802 RepID=A0A255ZJC9_9FLAO|nr:hypothetical protein [Flavobacterium cyanobacteriorum]OYQ41519.1 hypothetical protein CHU92_04335 [Flavobacterium cyanobacteriorum]
MKILIIIAALFGFGALSYGQAQDEQERLEQLPPPVTQRQVEQHANEADEMRVADPAFDRQLKKQQIKDMKENRKDAEKTVPGRAADTKKENSKTSTRPDKE